MIVFKGFFHALRVLLFAEFKERIKPSYLFTLPCGNRVQSYSYRFVYPKPSRSALLSLVNNKIYLFSFGLTFLKFIYHCYVFRAMHEITELSGPKYISNYKSDFFPWSFHNLNIRQTKQFWFYGVKALHKDVRKNDKSSDSIPSSESNTLYYRRNRIIIWIVTKMFLKLQLVSFYSVLIMN